MQSDQRIQECPIVRSAKWKPVSLFESFRFNIRRSELLRTTISGTWRNWPARRNKCSVLKSLQQKRGPVNRGSAKKTDDGLLTIGHIENISPDRRGWRIKQASCSYLLPQ